VLATILQMSQIISANNYCITDTHCLRVSKQSGKTGIFNVLPVAMLHTVSFPEHASLPCSAAVYFPVKYADVVP